MSEATNPVEELMQLSLGTIVNAMKAGKALSGQIKCDATACGAGLFWLTVEPAPDRHSCGHCEPQYWAHTNDEDRYAGTRPATINLVSVSLDELKNVVMQRLKDALSQMAQLEVDVLLKAGVSEGGAGAGLTVLSGSSCAGVLVERPRLPSD